jgi:hypothetical protein
VRERRSLDEVMVRTMESSTARIRELESELALTTAQSVDRFNRMHDAEVEAASLRAEVEKWVNETKRLVAANDRALGVEAALRAEVERLRQERDEWLKMDRDVCAMERIAHAAGYHEALDVIERATRVLYMHDNFNWEQYRTRYPREQKGMTP